MSEPSEANTGNDSDQDFDPSAEMMVHDYDDEHTLDEEEALSEDGNAEEIDKLTKEQDIPIEELLAMYGYSGDAQQQAATQGDEKSSESSANSNSNSPSPPSTSQKASTSRQSTPRASASTTTTPGAATAPSTTTYAPLDLSDSDDDESDEEYTDNEGEWRRTIQVGSDYQAAIPEGLSHYEDESDGHGHGRTTRGDRESRDILIWKPVGSLSDAQLDEYVRQYDGMFDDELGALPLGEHSRDDDHALYLLFKCRYSVRDALSQHALNPDPLPETSPVRKMMDPWTEEECRAFESGLRAFGKDFFNIKHQKIASRNVGEVVTFYYFWKKTERHEQFIQKHKIEKKKYALHPGTTDYMDRFLDEQENLTNSVMGGHGHSGGSGGSGASASALSGHHYSSSSLLHSGASSGAASGGQSGVTYHNLNTLNPRQSGSHPSQYQSSRHHSSNHSHSHHHHSSNTNTSSSSASSSNRHLHLHHQQQREHHHQHSHHQNPPHLGSNVRTINVSGSGETQTILIDNGDYNGTSSRDKSSSNPPIVLLGANTGGGGHSSRSRTSSSSSSASYYGKSSSSSRHAPSSTAAVADSSSASSASSSASSASHHATIVVGKNPIVIDGNWVSSSSAPGACAVASSVSSPPSAAAKGAKTASGSPTRLSTPSVSIYKIPTNPSTYHR